MTYHWHHTVPRHAGGTDDPSNLVRVTIEEHAELHFDRYLMYGHWGDWIAAHALSGQISGAEAATEARRQYMTNRVVSQSARDKMSSYNTIRVHSQASRDKRSAKMSGKNNPSYGLIHDETTRKKCSEGAKKQWERKLIWVNNGKETRRVVESEIPEGFTRGRGKRSK